MSAHFTNRFLTGAFLAVALAGIPATTFGQNQPAQIAHHDTAAPQLKKSSVTFTGPAEAQAIYQAAWRGDLAGVQAEVAKNPAVIHSEEDRVMKIAAEGGSLPVLKFLAEHDGDLAAYDYQGLSHAVGSGDLDLFDYIVSKLPAIPQEKKNELMVTSCYLDSLDMVKRVYALGGIDLDSTQWMDSPSSAAAKHGTIEILTYIVDELHTDFHAMNEDALRQSASHNRPDSVRFLLARHANPHALNDEALRLAVDGGDFDGHGGRDGYGEVVAALLEYGANPFVISPEKLAETENKHPQIAQMLKAKMAEINAQGALSAPPQDARARPFVPLLLPRRLNF